MNTDVVIRDILAFVVHNADKLSKNKFTGVTFVEDWQCYRIHKGHLLPTFLNNLDYSDGVVESIMKCVNSEEFFGLVDYDKLTGWFSIYK